MPVKRMPFWMIENSSPSDRDSVPRLSKDRRVRIEAAPQRRIAGAGVRVAHGAMIREVFHALADVVRCRLQRIDPRTLVRGYGQVAQPQRSRILCHHGEKRSTGMNNLVGHFFTGK
jgi:hypothetical protein